MPFADDAPPSSSILDGEGSSWRILFVNQPIPNQLAYSKRSGPTAQPSGVPFARSVDAVSRSTHKRRRAPLWDSGSRNGPRWPEGHETTERSKKDRQLIFLGFTTEGELHNMVAFGEAHRRQADRSDEIVEDLMLPTTRSGESRL